MPGSLFKSRPKSDRRLEWRTLKANFVKIPANKNVKIEIGLGKDLDNYQKEIDKALALADDKASPTTLAPLIASAAKVKASVATLKPLVKANQPMLTYLDGLKKDADWWITTANSAHPQVQHYGSWDSDTIKIAVPALLKLGAEFTKMDTLLKDALKKTAAYNPPTEVTRWPDYSKKVKPDLVKLTMLAKNQDANFTAMIKLLTGMKEPLSSLTWLMGGYNAGKFKGLPAVADWGKVVSTADEIEKLLDKPMHQINGL
jgi:hypothetical protein